MNTPPYWSPWQHVFVHAMMEIDSPRIALKIAAAEDAISKRLNELPLNQANAEELQALLSASNKLDRAKAEAVAKYPGRYTSFDRPNARTH
jgi:DNA uptake protein ComE-like DNA-binding protein